MNKEITNWTYQKGELIKDRLNSFSVAIAVILGLIIAFIAEFHNPLNKTTVYVTTKFSTWMFLGILFGVGFVIYFLLKLSSTLLFTIYKLIFGIKKDELSITEQKIVIGQSEKIINSDTKKITEVKLIDEANNPYLQFKGIEQKIGKAENKFSYNVVVPKDELFKAQQVVAHFKNLLN
jgi:hypothetical protein